MIAAAVQIQWTGRNRREVLRFLGDRWRGFSGQFPGRGEPDRRTVQFSTRSGVQSAVAGQTIYLASNGDLHAVGPHA